MHTWSGHGACKSRRPKAISSLLLPSNTIEPPAKCSKLRAKRRAMGIISNFFGDFWFHDASGFDELLDKPSLFKNHASTIVTLKTYFDNRVIGLAVLGCAADICDYPASHCIDTFLFTFLGGLCLFIPGSYRRLAGQTTPKVVCRPSINSTLNAQDCHKLQWQIDCAIDPLFRFARLSDQFQIRNTLTNSDV
jgi:hypothetical protein